MEEITVPMSQVEVWQKNLDVRATRKEAYERTKKQIKKLGVIKRCGAYKENGKYYILFGRLRYFVQKDLGHTEIDLTIVHPKSEAEKWEYLLADNDQPSEYIEDKLAEEVFQHREEINLSDYSIDVGKKYSLKDVLKEYAPDEDFSDLEKELDELGDMDLIDIVISVAKKYEADIRKWLANGEMDTATGLGQGVIKRCGLL